MLPQALNSTEPCPLKYAFPFSHRRVVSFGITPDCWTVLADKTLSRMWLDIVPLDESRYGAVTSVIRPTDRHATSRFGPVSFQSIVTCLRQMLYSSIPDFCISMMFYLSLDAITSLPNHRHSFRQVNLCFIR